VYFAHFGPRRDSPTGTHRRLREFRLQLRPSGALPRTGKRNRLQEEDADPPDKVLNLEKLAIAAEVNERVRDAVKSLSPRERDLIRRIFFLEMEKEEVCAELGVSRDYLRVLLHRAIEHLRDALENKDLPPKTREHEKKRG